MINSVVMTARLCTDPTIRYSQDGQTTFADFRVANQRKYKARNAQEYPTDFFTVKSSGQPAQFAEKYFRKGTKVEITGSLETDTFQDKETGKNRTNVYIRARDLGFAESKASAQENGVSTEPKPQSTAKTETTPDGFVSIPNGINEELPFT